MTGATIPLVRGTALAPIAGWLAQAGSEGALREVYERLPSGERLGLRPEEPNLGIEPRAWYATGAAAAMVVEAERYHAPLDRDAYLRLLAERIMRDGINVWHRSLFKLFVSPRTAVENIATAWERYYNEGRCLSEMKSPTSCVVTFTEWKGHRPPICESTAYCGTYILKVVGAQEVAIRRQRCIADGAPDCQWELNWAE